MAVTIQETPNPNAIKFTADTAIFSGDGSVSVMAGQESEHAILNDLMAIEGVDNVFGFQNFITVNKTFNGDWETLMPHIEEVFTKHGY